MSEYYEDEINTDQITCRGIKYRESAEVARQIDEFLANGGKIEVLSVDSKAEISYRFGDGRKKK